MLSRGLPAAFKTLSVNDEIYIGDTFLSENVTTKLTITKKTSQKIEAHDADNTLWSWTRKDLEILNGQGYPYAIFPSIEELEKDKAFYLEKRALRKEELLKSKEG